MFAHKAFIVFTLDGNLPLCESPGQLRALENVTRASVEAVANRKWVRFQFWGNYLFKLKDFHPPILCQGLRSQRLVDINIGHHWQLWPRLPRLSSDA